MRSNTIVGLTKRGKCSGITKIFNKENLGYAKAVNQGLKESLGKSFKYTCFRNNDLYFSTNWLEGLLSEFEEKVVAVYPLGMPSYTQLFGKSTREIFEKNKLRGLEYEIDFLEKDFEKNIKQICMENQTSVYDRFLQFLSDHCVLVKTNFMDRIGYFADERYGKYGSNDVDICWEIFSHGGKIKETNKSFVYYFRHKSLVDNIANRSELLTGSSKIL